MTILGTGRSEPKLQREVIDEYQRALTASSSYESARIALAAMLHESGQHLRARQEFAKLPDTNRPWLAMELAYYHLAANDPDRALELLDRSVKYSSNNRRYVLRSNDFDRLRGDARFQRLAGQP